MDNSALSGADGMGKAIPQRHFDWSDLSNGVR